MVPLLMLAFQQTQPAFDADQAWSAVSRRIRTLYWAQSSDGDRMNRLLSDAEPGAKACKSVSEFNDVVDAMIAKFGDSHFDFLTQDDQGYYLFDGFQKGDKAAPMPNIGAWFKKTRDGYTVQMVLNGGSAEAAGIRKGAVVTKVDGHPFTPVASLRPNVGKSVTLDYRTVGPDGSVQEKRALVTVSETPGQDMFLDASRKSERIIERDGKKIGYMHLWTMANIKFRQLLEDYVYSKAKDTDAFILDIRDGFGGQPDGYGDPFFRPEVNLQWTAGRGGAWNQLFGYGRPLVVIINEGSRSAKEVFSYIMKKSKRAILVGNHTAGDVLGTSPSAIGTWAYIEIPMVDLKVDGVRLEKNPVQADVQVSPEFDSQGNDRYLEKAIEVAVQKTHG